MPSHYTYRPEIDGLRAIAVLSVVIFHASETVLPGGFVGVDIFFVISGFLITSIIEKEIFSGNFSIFKFYERRIRRIFPPLFTVIIISLPFAWWLMTPDQMQDFSQSIVATSLFLSNYFFFLKTGYFEQNAYLLPLLHTWSLAVEEQYYVLFPLLMFVLYRDRRSFLLFVLTTLLISSFLLSIHWGETYPMRNFFMLPTRGWELLSGAILALNINRIRPYVEARVRLRTFLEFLGVFGLAHGVLLIDKGYPSPGLAVVPTVLGTVLLLASMSQQSIIGRILAGKLAVGIGLVSYSAYLWHQPIFAFARLSQNQNSTITLIGLIIVTLFLAYLSWRYIEKPFRN